MAWSRSGERMAERNDAGERLWEAGWESHELGQRRRLARLSLIEKLQWLEDAQRVVAHLARDRARRRFPGAAE
jgi:hypothetical protein